MLQRVGLGLAIVWIAAMLVAAWNQADRETLLFIAWSPAIILLVTGVVLHVVAWADRRLRP